MRRKGLLKEQKKNRHKKERKKQTNKQTNKQKKERKKKKKKKKFLRRGAPPRGRCSSGHKFTPWLPTPTQVIAAVEDEPERKGHSSHIMTLQSNPPPPFVFFLSFFFFFLIFFFFLLLRWTQTDYLARLTRHLLHEDEGEHWPVELDFELTGERRNKFFLKKKKERKNEETEE